MKVVTFSFEECIQNDEQESLLREIQGWPSVTGVGRLKPNSKDAVVARMCMAYISDSDEDSVHAIQKRLDSLPQIANVELPAARKGGSKTVMPLFTDLPITDLDMLALRSWYNLSPFTRGYTTTYNPDYSLYMTVTRDGSTFRYGFGNNRLSANSQVLNSNFSRICG